MFELDVCETERASIKDRSLRCRHHCWERTRTLVDADLGGDRKMDSLSDNRTDTEQHNDKKDKGTEMKIGRKTDFDTADDDTQITSY